MNQSDNTQPSVTDLFAACVKAEKACCEAPTDKVETAYIRYVQAFMEMISTPSTSVADILKKQEASLKMDMEGELENASFEDIIARPLSQRTFEQAAALSVYRDLRRLNDSLNTAVAEQVSE